MPFFVVLGCGGPGPATEDVDTGPPSDTSQDTRDTDPPDSVGPDSVDTAPEVPDTADTTDTAEVPDTADTTDTGDTTDTDTGDTEDTDTGDTTPCESIDDCLEVTCADGPSICVRCADGFAIAGGLCVDIDDCNPSPCGLATCVDTGPQSFDCVAMDAIPNATGGSAILSTPLGFFVATAGPGVFVDGAGQVIAGDVRFVVAPSGFVGERETNDGLAFDPAMLADLRFETLGGEPVWIANGQVVTAILPLPDDTALAEDDTALVYRYDDTGARWSLEVAGEVVVLAPLGESTPGDPRLGVSANLSRTSWYGVGATCANIVGCAAMSCDDTTCDTCGAGYSRTASGGCEDIDDCVGNACAPGTCVDEVGAHRCECPVGTFATSGAPPRCETCPPLAGCPAVRCTSPEDVVCATCDDLVCEPLSPCHVAGVCDPATGVCSNPPGNDGATCDDGATATHTDRCANGVCAGQPVICPADTRCTTYTANGTATCSATPTDCDDGDRCTVDRCDPESGCIRTAVVCDEAPIDACHLPASCEPATGECVSFPVSDGSPCDDGDACTLVDRCAGGVCEGSAPCDDQNPCTAGACSAGTCTYTLLEGPCDDGLTCTTGDTCLAGRCLGTPPAACNDDNPCTADRCDETGACLHEPVPGACVPADACTFGMCVEGACTSGASIVCDDGNPCTDDGCDPTRGCVFTPNAATCDDGNACTVGDVCALGTCTGGARDCDDDESCTFDDCDPANGCTHFAISAACSDGDACTVGDACDEGACAPGAARACDDSNPCTDDRCDPIQGCVHSPNESSCSDNDACTVGDVCNAGACVPGVARSCSDDNPCTRDVCNPTTGCANPSQAGTCDDGNACTTSDSCSAGACQPGAARDCDDGLDCTNDRCDAELGCVHEPVHARCDDGNGCTDGTCDLVLGCTQSPNTAACDDGDACTTSDTCSGGACVGGAAPDCDDDDACTIDACQPASGCVHSPRTCDDGDACTIDGCDPEAGCVTSPRAPCDDGNLCTSDSCDPITGCAFVPNTVPCDDGDPCSLSDTCSQGLCRPGVARVCNDNNPCTDDACVPGLGCVFSPNTAACNDGNACTVGDVCAAGACVGGAPKVCSASSPCHDAGTCDTVTGACSNPPSLVGTTCNDGNACTQRDTCDGFGLCVGANPKVCAAPGPCMEPGPCDTVTGLCAPYPSALGKGCNDGDACTVGDRCNGAGVCAAGPALSCAAPGTCRLAGACENGACVYPFAELGSGCDDGKTCSTGDACDAAGLCVGTPPNCIDDVACTDGGGNPLDCNDGNPCTDDGCDPGVGCTRVDNTAACNDGNACTSGDVCGAGTCGGTAIDCDDGNPCTDDSCDPTSGCVHVDNTQVLGACDTGHLGVCGAGRLHCQDGEAHCFPEVPGFGVQELVTVPDGLYDHTGGLVQQGWRLVTSDGRHFVSLSAGANGQAYTGWSWKRFDPSRGFALIDGGVVEANSFYVDGVIADPLGLYLHEWTGLAPATRVSLLDPLTRVIADDIGQIPGNGPISGQYDWVNRKVWMGHLYVGWAYRWDAANGWEPTDTNMEAIVALDGVGGAGALATDGVYLYVKRWALYPGDDWIRRVGTGFHGTVAGKNYGIIGAAPVPFGLTAAYHSDGFLYLPVADPHQLVRMRVSSATIEVCNGSDDDCDGEVDEGCEAVNDRCAGATLLDDGVHMIDLVNAFGPDGASGCGFGGGADLWFKGVASCTGVLTASSCGGGRGTPLEVFAGHDCAAATGTSGSCGRSECEDGVVARLSVTEGAPFLLRVGADGGGQAQVELSCEVDLCGDGVRGPAEACDDGNEVEGDGCNAACVVERCGDGVVQYGLREVCDDGENNSDTVSGACRTDCTPPGCGDGIVDPGEACDLGLGNSATAPDTCRPSCQAPACGDRVIDSLETCDDGNVQSEDGCSSLCAVERCGDGVLQVELGETCDDGNTAGGDGCGPSCLREFCGDGVRQSALGEACDRGPNGDATCTSTCAVRVCGVEQCNLRDDDCDGVVDEDCGLVVATQSLDGVPLMVVVPTTCQSEFDCNDQNVHTTDTCVGGACVHTPVPCDGPDADACTDGRRLSTYGACFNTGPSLLWDFDQPGAVEVDLSGYGHHGATTGTRVAGGRFGGALNLTGGQRVEASFAMPQTDFTISAWFKTTAPTGGIFAVVREQATATSPIDTDREIYLDDGELAYSVEPGVTSRCVGIGEPLGFDDGAWHFVTLVCEAGRDCRMLVDGVRVCTSKAWDDRSHVTDPQSFVVGVSQRGGSFEGLVDQVSVIKMALSDAEVVALMSGIDSPSRGRNMEVCDGVDDDCDGATDESCEDGDLCTVNDTCAAGACVAGTPKICSASAPTCRANTCDSKSGLCIEVDAANGTPCDDTNPCTHSSTCSAGVCGGGTAVPACNSDAAWFPTELLNGANKSLGKGKDVIAYRLNGQLGCIYSIDPLGQYGQWTEVPGAPGTWAHSGLLMFGSASETQVANTYICTDTFPVAGTVTVGVGPVFSLGGTISLPWPTTGFFKDIGLAPPPINVALPSFTLGLLPGAQLGHLYAPLRPDTRYFVLAGHLTVGIGPNGSPPIPLLNKQVNVVIDPFDPMIYLSWMGTQNVRAGLDQEFKTHAKTDYATGKVVDVRAGAIGFSLGGKLLHKARRQVWTGDFVPGGGLAFIDAINDAHAYLLLHAEFTPFRSSDNTLKSFKIGLRGDVSFGMDPARNGYDPATAVVGVWNKIFQDTWDDAANESLDFRLLLDADLTVVLPPIPWLINPLTGGPVAIVLPLGGATLLIDTTPSRELVSFRARTTDFVDKLIQSIPGVPLVPYFPSVDLNGFVKREGGVESWGVAADVSMPVGAVEFIGRLRVGSDGVRLDGLIEPGFIQLNPPLHIEPFTTELVLEGNRFCMVGTQQVPGLARQADGSDANTSCNVKLCIGAEGFAGSTFSCAPLCLGHSECASGKSCIWGVCQDSLANGAPCADSGACASGRCHVGFCVECWPGTAECGNGEFCDNAGYCQGKLGLGAPCVNLAGGSVMRNDWCQSGQCDTTCIECVARSVINLPPLNLPWTDTCPSGRYCGDEGICQPLRDGALPCISVKLAGPADHWCKSGDCGGPGTLCLECGPDTANTCPTTHFCDPLKGGVACSPKVADGTVCASNDACLSGHCGVAVDTVPRCYTPQSKNYDQSCQVAAECKSGACRVLDQKCGCAGQGANCPGGWCDVVTDTCQPKKQNGAACLTGAECVGGACTLDFRCYEPLAAPQGAPCLYHDECASNQCAGVPGGGGFGFCGCGGANANCPAGQVCYDGVSCGTQVGLGVPCTADGLCTSGHCAGVCVQCTTHAHCPNGWCAADLTCRPKSADGSVCLTNSECASGYCSQLTGCYSPWSVGIGGACGADLQCGSGQCVQVVPSTIGYCGCAGQDWLCGSGGVCYDGLNCGTKQPIGSPCLGYGSLCQSGHCFGGVCAECTADAHCGASRLCVSGACVYVPSCGDGVCDGGETCVSCPADCRGCWGAQCTYGCVAGTSCKNHPYACGCGWRCGCIGTLCTIWCCPDTCNNFWCDW